MNAEVQGKDAAGRQAEIRWQMDSVCKLVVGRCEGKIAGTGGRSRPGRACGPGKEGWSQHAGDTTRRPGCAVAGHTISQ